MQRSVGLISLGKFPEDCFVPCCLRYPAACCGEVHCSKNDDTDSTDLIALNETIRLMKEIDEVIEEHDGWPGAFFVGPTSDQ
jgi:hypothetical protein